MAQEILTLELPEEIIALFGSHSATASKARELLVIDMVREGHISQGKAAELLGIDRAEMMDLAARYEISSGGESAEELLRQIEEIEASINESSSREGD